MSEGGEDEGEDGGGGGGGAFDGKYKFASDPRLPSYSPSMEICCRSFMKICGSTSIIQKSGKGVFLSNPMQNSRFKCKELSKPNKKKVLTCRMKSWFGNYYLNVDDDLKIYSNRFVVDDHHAFVQCKGRLIKIGGGKGGGGGKAKESGGDEGGDEAGGEEESKKKSLLRKRL